MQAVLSFLSREFHRIHVGFSRLCSNCKRVPRKPFRLPTRLVTLTFRIFHLSPGLRLTPRASSHACHFAVTVV